MSFRNAVTLTELKARWQNFINSGQVNSGDVRQDILKSWYRCKELNINPYQTTVINVLPVNELKLRQQANCDLIDVSLPIMNKLYSFVTGSGFIVSLADSVGYLLKILGDADVATDARRGNFVAGANWSEASAGTNAIGTCLVVNKPLQVFAPEHFCICSHKWTCSSAPIIDPVNNHTIGVLTLTGRYNNVHSHTLGMVFSAVYAIENELALRHALMCRELANEQKNKIIDSIDEGIIAVDKQGRITQVNKVSCRLLGLTENRALDQDIRSILGSQNSELLQICLENQEVTYQPVTLFNILSQNKFQCTVISRSIKAEDGGNLGMVILLNEIQTVRKLAKQMLTNQARFTFEDLKGKDPRFLHTIEIARSAANSNSSVLLMGESGTGKEIFAQSIHNASSRRDGPFLAINCSGIPRDLIASELFGYAEGAFTGAKKGGNPGKFELADGGTLFLDEIGDMPLELQAMLLRVIEEKRIMRIGSGEYIPVDVRIISATNKNLWQEVKKGSFRDDLFYRLNVLTINMIPLRDRKDDIILLTYIFLDKFSRQQNKIIKNISPDCIEFLKSYSWPGNVRELQNLLERIVNTIASDTITFDLLPEEIKTVCPIKKESDNLTAIENNEKDIISILLKKHDFNISRVSRELKIARTTLYRKIKKYNLSSNR